VASTAEDHVQLLGRLCGICGGRIGAGTGFILSEYFNFFVLTVIPTVPRNHVTVPEMCDRSYEPEYLNVGSRLGQSTVLPLRGGG
jgi:hypothetical protein